METIPNFIWSYGYRAASRRGAVCFWPNEVQRAIRKLRKSDRFISAQKAHAAADAKSKKIGEKLTLMSEDEYGSDEKNHARDIDANVRRIEVDIREMNREVTVPSGIFVEYPKMVRDAFEVCGHECSMRDFLLWRSASCRIDNPPLSDHLMLVVERFYPRSSADDGWKEWTSGWTAAQWAEHNAAEDCQRLIEAGGWPEE